MGTETNFIDRLQPRQELHPQIGQLKYQTLSAVKPVERHQQQLVMVQIRQRSMRHLKLPRNIWPSYRSHEQTLLSNG